MRLIKLVFLVILLMGIPAYAIDYKSVSVERGDKVPVVWDGKQAEEMGYDRLSTEEKKQWVVVQNHNSHPVQVNFEFKLGHKDAPWKSYSSEMGGEILTMEPRSESIICLGEDIKGLKIVYVNVDKSEATKKALNAIGIVANGLANTIKTEDNN